MDSDGDFNRSNWIKLRKKLLTRKYANSSDAYDAIREMLAKLNDPYTRFLDPKQFYEMRIDTSGELTGVGIQIVKDEESDNFVIVSPIEGSPAYQAGIKAKDRIFSIDKINNTKEGYLVGYVRIKQFNANASREMKDTLLDYENKDVAGYVLDLRSNPGGLLDSSIDISRQFINKGIIVSTLSKDGLKEIKRLMEVL